MLRDVNRLHSRVRTVLAIGEQQFQSRSPAWGVHTTQQQCLGSPGSTPACACSFPPKAPQNTMLCSIPHTSQLAKSSQLYFN